MPLPRYRSTSPQASIGTTAPQQEMARFAGTLADRIQGVTNVVYQAQSRSAEQKAKEDAQTMFADQGLSAELDENDTIYARAYNNAISNYHRKQVSIDTSKQMAIYANEYKNDPIGFKEVSDSYYKATSSELPEHLKADFAIDFEADKARYEPSIIQNALNIQKEKDIALSNEVKVDSLNASTLAARDGNAELAQYNLEKTLTTIDSDETNGYISADEARKQRTAAKKDVSDAIFRGQFDTILETKTIDDAQEYINQFSESQPQGYDEQQREALANEFQSQLNSRIRNEKANLQATQQDTNIAVGDAIKVFKAGKQPDNMASVEDTLQFASPTKQHEYLVAKQAYKITNKVSRIFIKRPDINFNVFNDDLMLFWRLL